MKKLVCFAAAWAVAIPSACAYARDDNGGVIRQFNDAAFSAVRTAGASDGAAARAYAMVNAAMYDAVNGTQGSGKDREPAFLAPDRKVRGDAVVAAATAAHDVLAELFPAQSSSLPDTAAAKADDEKVAAGRAWGERVAAAVLDARRYDGASPSYTQPSPGGFGTFAGGLGNAQFQDLAPFAIADPRAYEGTGPPALTSHEYAVAFNDVKQAGSAGNPDQEAFDTFDFWALAGGTNQPPGAWLQIAEAVSTHLKLADTARLFALESMAMADTVAPTYRTKAKFFAWRPTAAIQQAKDDGNDETAPDPTWTARSGQVGSSPEHWSGHSTFSAAGAAVLAGFFCTDRIAFSLATDPGHAARSYDSFSAAADQAGRSRVLGGLHFEFSNQAGLAAGRAIASEVLSSALLVAHGNTHHNGCPR